MFDACHQRPNSLETVRIPKDSRKRADQCCRQRPARCHPAPSPMNRDQACPRILLRYCRGPDPIHAARIARSKVTVAIKAIARVFNNARRRGETVLVTFLLCFSGPLIGSGSKPKGEPSSTGAPRKIANGAMRHRHQFTRGAALTCNNYDARRQRSVVTNERNLCSIGAPTRERIFRTLGDGARRMLCLRVGNPDRSLIELRALTTLR